MGGGSNVIVAAVRFTDVIVAVLVYQYLDRDYSGSWNDFHP